MKAGDCEENIEGFLAEIGGKYLNLVQDDPGIGVSHAYCPYLLSRSCTESVVFIDGGNSFNPYLMTRYCRMFSVGERSVMDKVQLSRAFTCHQMSALLGEHLESAVIRFGAGAVVVSDPACLYVERAAEEDVMDEFQQAYRHLREITYSRRLTTLIVCSNRMPHFLDGGSVEDLRQRRADRCTEMILSKLADSVYRIDGVRGGFSVVRVKHPYFREGSAIFVPSRRTPATLEYVLAARGLSSSKNSLGGERSLIRPSSSFASLGDTGANI